MSRRAKVGVNVFLIVFGLYLVISWYFSGLIITPRRTKLSNSMTWLTERNGLSYEEQMAQFGEPQSFSVTGVEGVAIKGWFFDNSAECAVIIAHGWNSNRIGSHKFMDIFWDRGCDVVVYDHRGHGESGGEAGTGGNLEKLDLITVTEWVSAETGLPHSKIGWHGSSWGAATALQAAALDQEIGFVIADSSFKDWKTAIVERAVRQYGGSIQIFTPAAMSLSGIRTGTHYRDASPYDAVVAAAAPIMLIHSTGDTQTLSWQSADINAQLDPSNSEFHQTDWGAEHVRDVDVRPEQYRELVYQFIDTHVGEFGGVE
ncbi:MAG: alpha/beta hydrolase [Candidatus Promineifilaceae bacterium]